MLDRDFSIKGRLRFLAVTLSLGVILSAWLLTSHAIPLLDRPFAAEPGKTLIWLAMPCSVAALVLFPTVRILLWLVVLAMHAARLPRRHVTAFALRFGLITPDQILAGTAERD